MKSKKTILIVEDDPLMLQEVSTILEEEGFIVMKASNGAVALDILGKNKMPNLILLDMIMPVMDGWEFAKNYQQKFPNRAPIMVITAAPDGDVRAKDVGAIAWLGKPYPIAEMIGLIKHLEI